MVEPANSKWPFSCPLEKRRFSLGLLMPPTTNAPISVCTTGPKFRVAINVQQRRFSTNTG